MFANLVVLVDFSAKATLNYIVINSPTSWGQLAINVRVILMLMTMMDMLMSLW